MVSNNRQFKRIDKIINLLYCIADAVPRKWDMSIIENISVGGIKFLAPTDLELKNKIVQLRIKLPDLAPHLLEIDALVLGTNPRYNPKFSEIRAKFINLTELNKEHLAILEKMIARQDVKNVPDLGKI